MTREKLMQEVGKPIFKIIGLTQLILIITFLSSLFIWIWGTWDLAWKVGLSSFIGICITAIIYKASKDLVMQSVDKALNNDNPNKSNFQKRLEKLTEERNKKEN